MAHNSGITPELALPVREVRRMRLMQEAVKEISISNLLRTIRFRQRSRQGRAPAEDHPGPRVGVTG